MMRKLLQLNHTRRRIVRVLACLVVFCTTYALILPAITLEKQTHCGQAAHVHDEGCWSWRLICGQEKAEAHSHGPDCYDEDGNLICGLEETEGHIHSEDCYEKYLSCELPEHSHSLACYADSSADLEYPALWEQSLPQELSGDWAEDLVAVALSQRGYAESERNYIVTPSGTQKGYTRYGAWYGSPYGDWCAMFISFCLHYARIPANSMPVEAECNRWIAALEEKSLYKPASEGAPKAGDLVFFTDNGENASHVAIVTQADEKEIHTLEGNYGDRVAECRYDLDDERLLGYGLLPQNPDPYARQLQAAVGSYDVTLYYGAAAQLPADAILQVREYEADSPEYAQAREAWLAEKEAQGETVDENALGFAALDVSLLDSEGRELEPAAPVRVEITMAQLPEELSQEDMQKSMELHHLVEEGQALKVQESVNAESPQAEGSIQAEADSATASIEVEGLSPFVITWYYNYNTRATINLRYFDTEGNEITSLVPGSIEQQVTNSDTWIYLPDPQYAKTIEGYEYQQVKYNNINVDYIRLFYQSRRYYIHIYHADEENQVEELNGGTNVTINIDYYYQRTTPEPVTEDVTLRLHYLGPNGELEQQDVPVQATVEGVTVALTGDYQKSFPGYVFDSRSCGTMTDFDSVLVKMVENNGNMVSACYFVKDGVASTQAYLFDGQPMNISFNYVDEERPVVLRLLYRDGSGTDLAEALDLPLTATKAGTLIDLTDSQYRKEISGWIFEELSSNDFTDFDAVRVLLQPNQDGSAYQAVCSFQKNGVDLGGYTFDETPMEITYTYTEVPHEERYVTLHLSYVDASGNLISANRDLSVLATTEGTLVDLLDSQCFKDIDGYTLVSKKCYNAELSDTVLIKLVYDQSSGQTVPACFLMDGDTPLDGAIPFENDSLPVTYTYSDGSEPASVLVTLRLHYRDADGVELDDAVTVPVMATTEGTVIDLSDEEYLKQFDGYNFELLSCYQYQGFDAVEVKLQEADGELVPVCFFLKDGNRYPGGIDFDGDLSRDIDYNYSGGLTGNEPRLRIHYVDQNGELAVESFPIFVSEDGTRVYLKAEPYLKSFSGREFQYAAYRDFVGFDQVELVMQDGTPVIYFMNGEAYLTANNVKAYSMETGVIDLTMYYVGVNDWLDVRVHYLYYHDGSNDPLAADRSAHLEMEDGQPKSLSLAEYTPAELEGKVFAGCTCTLTNGRQITNFDTVRVFYDESGTKCVQLYRNGTVVGSTPVVGVLEINAFYIDADDNTGGWTGGGTRPGAIETQPLPEIHIGDLPEATGSKTLTPNGDGTYTLTLSMQVPKIEAAVSNKVNVVIVFDSSNSMNEAGSQTAQFVQDNEGSYLHDSNSDPLAGAIYDGYFQIGKARYAIGDRVTTFIKVPSDTDPSGYATKTVQLQYRTADRHKLVPTRMDVAKENVKALGDALLQKNTASLPDAVQLAFVEYGTVVFRTESPTTSQSVFDQDYVGPCDDYARSDCDGRHILGATNWEDALRAANAVQFGDNDPTYIIFISDGNPTVRSSEEYPDDDGTTVGTPSLGMKDERIPGIHGTGNSDINEYNLGAAITAAQEIIDAEKYLYTVGIFGDATNMQRLPHHAYYEGSDAAHIEQAFRDIIDEMAVRIGYTNLSIVDGITSMTSSTLVHGDPRDFTYKVVDENNNDVTDQYLSPEQRNARYERSPGSDKESGSVTWELGAKDLLLDGGTYSVSFVVWPNQEAYDLVADLNNGIRQFSELNEVEQSQVVGSGPGGDQRPFSLRTNTRQSITYSTAKEVTDSSGTYVTYGSPQEAELEFPDPMPLTDSVVDVVKEWNTSLDPSELTEFLENHPDFQAVLDLMKEDQVYIGDIHIPPQEGFVWYDLAPNGDHNYYHISAGLMVSDQEAAAHNIPVYKVEEIEGVEVRTPYYPTVTYTDPDTGVSTLYHVLETGRDYSFQEAPFDVHFELEERIFHPMVVDGQLMDVTIDYGEDENVVVRKVPFGQTLTAVNSLRGGLNIVKRIVDENGVQLPQYSEADKESVFWICGQITKDGQPMTDLEYRYYYYNDDGSANGRSDKAKLPMDENGCFTLPVQVNQTLRIVNVPTGCDYRFFEDTTRNGFYSFYSIEGSATTNDWEGQVVPIDTSDSMQVTDGVLTGVSLPNASQLITVRNTRKPGSIEILKTDTTLTKKLEGAIFGLYSDSAGSTRALDADGNPVASETTGQDGIVRFDNLLPGTYYLFEEEAPTGYTALQRCVVLKLTNNLLKYTLNDRPYQDEIPAPDPEAEENPPYVLQATIPNSSGYVLPDTGGSGTQLLQLWGLCLMLAAVSPILVSFMLKIKIKTERKQKS